MIERGVFGIGNPLLDILAKVAPGMCNAFEIVWVIQYSIKLATSNDPKLKGYFIRGQLSANEILSNGLWQRKLNISIFLIGII